MTAPTMPAPPSGRTVLIVDDEPIIRQIARLSLTSSGFLCTEAESAAAALAAVQTAATPFDLILLDLTLPDGDGATLIPAIRKRAPATRILVVSGLGELDPFRIGVDGSLAKPFTRSTLLSAVQYVLAK